MVFLLKECRCYDGVNMFYFNVLIVVFLLEEFRCYDDVVMQQ